MKTMKVFRKITIQLLNLPLSIITSDWYRRPWTRRASRSISCVRSLKNLEDCVDVDGHGVIPKDEQDGGQGWYCDDDAGDHLVVNLNQWWSWTEGWASNWKQWTQTMMASWQDDKLTRWEVDKMRSWQDDKLTTRVEWKFILLSLLGSEHQMGVDMATQTSPSFPMVRSSSYFVI